MNTEPTPKFLENNAKSIKSERWIKLLQQGKTRKLTEELCITFQHFADYSYATLPDDKYEVVNGIVSQFLFIMSRPEYQIPERFIPKLVELAPVIANVVAMSRFQTTDDALIEVIGHSQNFHKILVLYSARNLHYVNPAALFRIDPRLASQWYWSYYITPGSYPGKTVYENMVKHVAYLDSKLQILDPSVLIAYFNSTYIDNVGYRRLKEQINLLLQEATKNVVIENTPDGTIAICSGKWYPRSAVYRCYAKSVKALARTHPLELIHLGEDIPDLDKSDFVRVHKIRASNLNPDLKAIAKNPYSAVFFPDIGMTFESIYLSNLRISPVQFMGYGHPSSTFGSKIDYFFGGADLETPGENYSELLVCLPGNGQPTIRPCHTDAQEALSARSKHVRDDRVVVNCPWSQDKTTWPLIDCLRKIKDKCLSRVLFRLYPNEAINRCNYFIPYLQGIIETLGDPSCVEVHQAFGQDYMDRMAAGALTLDSWPFNGYNTVIDSLLLGVPVLTLRGRQCFERVGAEVIGRAGMRELIAESEQEYIDKAVALIDNPTWLAICSDKAKAVKLDFAEENGEAFVEAVENILKEKLT